MAAAVPSMAGGAAARRAADRQTVSRRDVRIPVVLAALLGAALGASQANAESVGDYGRPAESAFVDRFLPWLNGGSLDFTRRTVSAAPYTDDEIMLRNQAYGILLPPELRERSRLTLAGVDFVELWNLIAASKPAFDVRSYGDSLVARSYRSHEARYARLVDDIRADMGLAGPFFATAHRVMDADSVRERSFFYVSRIRADNIDLGRKRIGENRLLIAEVYRRFRERIASYRYALETLLVLTPSPAAVQAERALYLLEERFAKLTEPVTVASGRLITK